ncbi:MAG TPA: hypothetical protein VGV18_02200 [Verrucomicrobiae bacterium]|nr:hypothetical protein [Verrucomicrobiae bacterium]
MRESRGSQKKIHPQYGFGAVKLPGRSQSPLTLVVIRGFGQELMKATRRSLWRIVRGFLSRWPVEETSRFIKQNNQLEAVRVLSDERLRNLTARVMASAYFRAV